MGRKKESTEFHRGLRLCPRTLPYKPLTKKENLKYNQLSSNLMVKSADQIEKELLERINTAVGIAFHDIKVLKKKIELSENEEPEVTNNETYQERMERILVDNPQAYSAWTNEEEETLMKYASQGKPNKEIAKLMGRQVGGIRSRIKKIAERDDDDDGNASTKAQIYYPNAGKEWTEAEDRELMGYAKKIPLYDIFPILERPFQEVKDRVCKLDPTYKDKH
jgi:DNA-binding CsgD family transcriptional regulator